MLARCAVLPCPSPASGPQVLLLSKLKGRLNHAESTLLQVFFLKNLKPFGITTFRKTGEGVVVMVNHLLETSHPLLPQLCDSVSPWPTRLPFSVHTSKFRMPQPLCLPLLRKHRGGGYILPILELAIRSEIRPDRRLETLRPLGVQGCSRPPVTGRVSHTSQLETGCWPPICFFWSPTGTQRIRTILLRACPFPLLQQEISDFSSTREKRRMPSASSGNLGVKA